MELWLRSTVKSITLHSVRMLALNCIFSLSPKLKVNSAGTLKMLAGYGSIVDQ